MKYFLPKDILSNNGSKVGNKAKNLAILVQNGWNIPEFIVISGQEISELLGDNELFFKLVRNIHEKFPQDFYAVRSSAQNEDKKESSMAGQYHTEINVIPSLLGEAIKKVISKNSSNQSDISIIIQKYIDAEISGVCFTRNPKGSLESIIEYFPGKGEDIVGGKNKPKRLTYIPNKNHIILGFSTAIFREIEDCFGFPQDIEWCIKDRVLYILQSRSITTLSDEQYERILPLEKEISTKKYFFLQKNELSEIAPNPTPLTFSLLEKIYAKNGPIDKVYQKHNIQYRDTKFLYQIGNSLLVDREKEIQSLLPAYSIDCKSGKSGFHRMRGIFTTLRNILGTLFLKEDSRLIEDFQEAIDLFEVNEDIEDAISQFLEDYALIFEVNLFASKYLQNLRNLIRNEKESSLINKILNTDSSFFGKSKRLIFPMISKDFFSGNTLEFIDESDTMFSFGKEGFIDKEVKVWWLSLPEWKKKAYRLPIVKAIDFVKYREYSRILMIKNKTELLKAFKKAIQNNQIDENLITFFLLEEFCSQKLDKKSAQKRMEIYKKYKSLNISNTISSEVYEFLDIGNKNYGISSGIAKGKVISLDNVVMINDHSILQVDILSPDLISYFPKIEGIISMNGGILSHLAILARERKLPIVIVSEYFKDGTEIEINGDTGEVMKIL